MKKIIITAMLVLFTIASYSQQPVYKASLDSLKTIIDPLKQEVIITRLITANPNDDFEQYKAMLAGNFAAAKKTTKALAYFKQLQGRSRSMYLGSVVSSILAYDVKAAEALVKEELAKADNTDQDRRTLLNLHSQVLEKKGDYVNAFVAFKEYYDQAQRKSPGLTAQYYYLMSKSGNRQEALPELEKAVLAGVANEDMKLELATAFGKLNPGKDSKTHVAGLVKQFEDKHKAELLTKMVKEDAPNFTVKDLNGKTVSLSDFKGKTVVLDFWATWCGPCKRALPAMQMTVDKYKADPNVKFLFIHTWESVANPKEEAMQYFADNNFRLPLYMDVKDPATNKNPAVSAFDVKGIPAKFVIDGEGKIRFKTSGFGGTNEAAVNELSAMIELSRTMAQTLPADTSFTGLFNSVKSEVDAPRMELMVNEMIKKNQGDRDQILIDASAQNTAIAFAEAGNIARAKYWINKIKENSWKTSTFSAVMMKLIDAGKLGEAESIVGPVVNPSAQSISEFSFTEEDKQQFRFLYGTIRFKQGKYKEALPYLSPLEGSRNGGNPELYAIALSRTGDVDSAFAEINKVMSKSAHFGADFQQEARAVYIKKYGNDNGFKVKLDSVAAAESKKMLAKVEKMKVNEPAQNFEITDFNGKTVSLKSLKGKTIFIDFWATWCVPCVASFPGMQKAVDYYKNDNSVVFLFVHTAEKNINATEEAKKMIASKKHNFDVYMDLKDKTTGKNPMLSAFQVRGLPTKLVIDKDGIIRYRTAGFIGIDEAIPEISTMIELSKKPVGNN
jgi:thiol-disulfide isomerase/thioredoxin